METIEEKTFRIKKIRKNGGYWELYPKESKRPLRIKVDMVYGNLPPVWKFPWQCHMLKLKSLVDRYIIHAEMDGRVLFDIPEDKYSDEMKKELARIKKIEAEYAVFEKEYRDSVKTQLAEYLPKVQAVADIEDEIGKLSVCWLRYLKMFLFMQYGNKEEQQRLFLLYWLVIIANRLYKRHVDVESSLSVVFAVGDLKVKNFATDELSEELVKQIEEKPEFRNDRAFALYFEIKQELNRVLPPAPKRLEVYLVQVIGQLLEAYAYDAAELHCKRPRDFWGDTTNTDNEAYRYMVCEMKLPQFSSLIVEKKFTVDEIERFNSRL